MRAIPPPADPPDDDGGSGDGSGGDGTGGTGDGSGTGICENCAMFECPNWSEYMGKVDEIINKIPPPPDWEQVADTFYERVVPKAINDLDNMLKDSFLPKMMSDLENMLGTAPEPPSSPAILEPSSIPTPSSPTVNDYADTLNQAKPEMAENPDLDNATFSADDVKNEAPEIQFREDESGGFDLPMSNPVDSLPALPFDDFPMPGMGSAGEWDHQPIMPDNTFPMPSEGSSGATDPGTPPIPSESGNEAPIPGQEYNAPIPGGTDIEIGNYKKHPDDPDGSG